MHPNIFKNETNQITTYEYKFNHSSSQTIIKLIEKIKNGTTNYT